MEWCEAGDISSNNLCRAYIMGLHDAYTGLPTQFARKVFCVPDGVPAQQLQKIVVKYANENPEGLHVSGTLTAASALVVAFLCEEQSAD